MAEDVQISGIFVKAEDVQISGIFVSRCFNKNNRRGHPCPMDTFSSFL